MAQKMCSVSLLRKIIFSTISKNSFSTSSSANAKVGFIGCGNMGGHMARNLLKKGHSLNVFDVSPAACQALKAEGVTVVKTAEEAAVDRDFVITMLPNSQIVYETYDGIIKAGFTDKTIFIDSSTIDPTVAQQVQKIVKAAGATFVDAPVSGGVLGAENATLTFMVGGTKQEYEAVKSLLEGMGRRITHCGNHGMGQAAKICNNMLLGIEMIGVCEAMNLAVRLGLDAKTFTDIVNASTGRCWSSECNHPVPGVSEKTPANNDYKGGFSTELITKDLGLASNVAVSSDTPIPLGAAAHQIYRTLKTIGLGNKDFSVVYEFLKNKNA